MQYSFYHNINNLDSNVFLVNKFDTFMKAKFNNNRVSWKKAELAAFYHQLHSFCISIRCSYICIWSKFDIYKIFFMQNRPPCVRLSELKIKLREGNNSPTNSGGMQWFHVKHPKYIYQYNRDWKRRVFMVWQLIRHQTKIWYNAMAMPR